MDSEGRKVIVCDNGTGVSSDCISLKPLFLSRDILLAFPPLDREIFLTF